MTVDSLFASLKAGLEDYWQVPANIVSCCCTFRVLHVHIAHAVMSANYCERFQSWARSFAAPMHTASIVFAQQSR